MNPISLTKFNTLKSVSDAVSRLVAAVALVCVSSLLLSACGVGNGTDGDDPVVVENPVAFIKRALLFDEDDNDLITDDLTEPALFREGAILYIKDRASPSSRSFDISSAAFPTDALYDVRDLEVSYDGTKLLFSMRAPEIENADEEDQPKWNIWEYDVPSATLRRLIESDTTAEEGHDLSPVYLPDGRILFSSTRQKTSKAILLDEDLGKPQFSGLDEERDVEAFVLHVMDEDGLNIEQITFNQSHDLDPIVRSDGKVVFTRWDNAGNTNGNGMNLYEVNPDGTELNYLYGRHSHDSGDTGTTVQYAKPREADNGNIVVQLREFVSPSLGFLPVEVDVQNYIEHDLEIGGTGISGQTDIITGLDTSGQPNPEGNYGALFPLYDGTNRYLASWSICRVQNSLTLDQENAGEVPTIELCSDQNLAELGTTYEAAPPLYGLWIVDASDDTKLPLQLPEEGFQYDEAVIMTDRPLPTFIANASLDDDAQVLADNGLGVLHIRSVYDLDGSFNAMGSGVANLDAMMDPGVTTPDNRPAWFLRVEKPASIPSDEVRDFDNSAFGRSNQSMREILGYAPVEPDGSVKVAVPANVALAFSVLDKDGKRIQSTARHQNWLQVRPGETVECIGCHDDSSTAAHGRSEAAPDAVNQGAPTTGVEFPNSVAALSPDMGDTMAETYATVNDVRRLTPDLHYIDEWTAMGFTQATTLRYAYKDLETALPTLATCYEDDDANDRDSFDDYTDWGVYCRTIINYEDQIHPLWAVNREILDVDEVTVLEDRTCTTCHNITADIGGPMVPAGQLDLSDGQSADENREDFYKSFVELFFNDNEQELVTDINMVTTLEDVDSSDELIPDPQVDGNGDPIIDPDTGEQLVLFINPLDPIIVPPTMNSAGALNSAAFLSKFETGGTHVGYLSGAELRLISEWLDIGAQYFNNPFDAPAN